MTTRNNPQRQALYMTGHVSPADVAALAAMPPETLAAVLRHVTTAARKHTRADDVEALAVPIIGRVWQDGDDVRKTANVAVALAARTVALAHANVDSLDAWAGEHGDMVETIAHAGIDRSGLWSQWSPSPEARYETTDRDVWHMALATVRRQDRDAWRILRDAGRAYMAHGARRCHVCQGAETEARDDVARTGRRVSLPGILAHTRGLVASDSDYHRLRRLTLAAVALVDVDRVARVAYGVKPHAGLWSDEARTVARDAAPVGPAWAARMRGQDTPRGPRMRPADEMPGKRERQARGLPNTDAVEVRLPDGSRAVRSESEHYAPLREARTRDDVRAEAHAAAPSRAVREGQRSRGNGPDLCAMVPARPSHAAPWRP